METNEREENTSRKLIPLLGHESEATAFVVDDYPYGFTLRCKIRYWVEHKRNHGFRFCSQTTNPKLSFEKWNKPKKGIYTRIAMGMYQTADDGYVHHCGLSEYSNADESKAFERVWGFCLGEDARKILDHWIRCKEAYEARGDKGLIAELVQEHKEGKGVDM